MKQTAEEFYKDYCNKRITIGSLNGHERLEVMIEFAKLHVETALKAASEKVTIVESESPFGGNNYSVSQESILNAYPLENIK